MRAKSLVSVIGVVVFAASSLVFSTPAAQASSTKCVRDAPVTTCVTASDGKSLGWKREGSYLLAASKVDTTSTCSVTSTSSESFSVSVSVSADFKAWIFKVVDVTISGGWEGTTSLAAGVSRTFTQKKGETYRCEWGEAIYQSKLTITKTANGSSTTTTGTATGPQEMQLRVVKL
jgi:hypothetical protein